jgi:hypothetical protein
MHMQVCVRSIAFGLLALLGAACSASPEPISSTPVPGEKSAGGPTSEERADEEAKPPGTDVRPKLAAFSEAEVDALFRHYVCAGCHNARNDGPDMSSVTKLVNLPSGSRSRTACANSRFRVLIAPGAHEQSLLFHKLAGSHDCGNKMPLGGGPRLTDAELDRLASYIDALE